VGAGAEFLLDFTCYSHRADISGKDRDLKQNRWGRDEYQMLSRQSHFKCHL
jgi:hypothetical protein